MHCIQQTQKETKEIKNTIIRLKKQKRLMGRMKKVMVMEIIVWYRIFRVIAIAKMLVLAGLVKKGMQGKGRKGRGGWRDF